MTAKHFGRKNIILNENRRLHLGPAKIFTEQNIIPF
jgi:hypothetical protein